MIYKQRLLTKSGQSRLGIARQQETNEDRLNQSLTKGGLLAFDARKHEVFSSSLLPGYTNSPETSQFSPFFCKVKSGLFVVIG